MRKLLDSNERLVYVDAGHNEYVIRYKDIPDFIVDYNYKKGSTNLIFYEYGYGAICPLITTIGFFLDYCEPKVRKDIINRLVSLQQGKKVRNYKVTDSSSIVLLFQKELLKI